MNHDIATQLVAMLGQCLVDNADNIAGKVLAAAPVAGVVASGLIEKAWVKVAIQAIGSLLTTFSRKPGSDSQQNG